MVNSVNAKVSTVTSTRVIPQGSRVSEYLRTLSKRPTYNVRFLRKLVCAACLLLLLFAPATTPAQTPAAFSVRNYGGRCLDFGPPPQASGSPVFIFDCNGTVAQQVRLTEVNDRHEVILHAGTKCIGAAANFVVNQAPLQLQDCNSSTGQIFALDGDSIIVAADRNLVVQVQKARSANRTPLVLGNRNLSDSEFWTFSPVDRSAAKPTLGFVRVPQEKDFPRAIQEAKPGTVIDISPGVDIDLTGCAPAVASATACPAACFQVPSGVTIRGDRHGTPMGPQLLVGLNDRDHRNKTLFQIAGENVRITGLRLRGPTRDRTAKVPNFDGICAPDNFPSIIDHDDISDWTEAAINVVDSNDDIECHAGTLSRPQNVRVLRNFIHDNQNWDGGGYGVVTGSGAYPFIMGNIFLRNRHSIAADGKALTGYSAWFNIVLSDSPDYSAIGHQHQQDFDMHGTEPSAHHTGGIAGSDVEIARNLFLGTNRPNYDLRGNPCALEKFHNNIVRQGQGGAIKLEGGADSNRLDIRDNRFESPNPTDRFGVADFDGDGKDDLFLATGTAWYYAPAGNAEWRYLSDKTEQIGSLLFGDFDGDGRADVFTQRGRDWLVSWGGISDWEKINVSDARMSEFAIGDFVGDRRADVFYARGDQWFVSDGGVGPFVPYATSSFRIGDLRFGDFDGDGKTDVMSVVANQWMVSYAKGDHHWQRLRAKLTDKVEGLVIYDFDGNGHADIATVTPVLSGHNITRFDWKVSRDGTGNWTPLRSIAVSTPVAAIGRFDDKPGADILIWNSRSLDVISSGTAPPVLQSRQDMR